MYSYDHRTAAADFPIDEDFVKEIAEAFNRKYARTRFTQGTPEVRNYGHMYHLRARFEPYNRAGVDSMDLWFEYKRRGLFVYHGKIKIQVAAQSPSMDVEKEGFRHIMAERSYRYKGETPEELAKRAFELSKFMD